MPEPCCAMMGEYLNQTCEEHGPDCPEQILRTFNSGLIAIPVRDGGSSAVPIHYCPWCGHQLTPRPVDDPDFPGEQVATLKLPLKARRLDRLTDALEAQYGEGLLMHQRGSYISFVRLTKSN